MSEVKLPLERFEVTDDGYRLQPTRAAVGGLVHSHEVAALELAYAELQERCAKAERERDEARAWQLAVAEGTGYINYAEGQGGYEIAPAETIVAAYTNAVEERDEACINVSRMRATLSEALNELDAARKQLEVARFETAKLQVGWEEHHRDYEVARAYVAELTVEVADLRRIKTAAEAWARCCDDDLGDSYRQPAMDILSGIGPNGEMKP